MAKSTVVPQDVQNNISLRERVNFGVLEDGLNTISAIGTVLDYTGEVCQGQGERLTIIAAGLGEALKVVRSRMAAEIEVR